MASSPSERSYPVTYHCSSCGRSWEGDMDETGVSCCGVVPGESYDSQVARDWMDDHDPAGYAEDPLGGAW